VIGRIGFHPLRITALEDEKSQANLRAGQSYSRTSTAPLQRLHFGDMRCFHSYQGSRSSTARFACRRRDRVLAPLRPWVRPSLGLPCRGSRPYSAQPDGPQTAIPSGLHLENDEPDREQPHELPRVLRRAREEYTSSKGKKVGLLAITVAPLRIFLGAFSDLRPGLDESRRGIVMPGIDPNHPIRQSS